MRFFAKTMKIIHILPLLRFTQRTDHNYYIILVSIAKISRMNRYSYDIDK